MSDHTTEDKDPKWLRIEPRARGDDISQGLAACTADPLWMLARQWQTGEFQGEDAGSPLDVTLGYSTQSLEYIRLGEGGAPFPLPEGPLERAVERERTQLNWRQRVQAGQQFERLLRVELGQDPVIAVEGVLAAYRAHYPLKAPVVEAWTETDRATRRFISYMQGRVPDGLPLLKDLDLQDKDHHHVLARGGIPAARLLRVLQALQDWCERLDLGPVSTEGDEPPDAWQPVSTEGGDPPDAWQPEPLHYRFELNPPALTQAPQTQLVAPSYRNGELDWYTFNVVRQLENWKAGKTIHTHATHTTVGGSSMRWWAFEDAATHFGEMSVDRPDLAKLILMEFVLIYGDDWFSVPVPVQMPGLVRVDGLKVTNVFGETIGRITEEDGTEPAPIRPVRYIDPDPDHPELCWEMFSLSPVPDRVLPGVGDPSQPGMGDAAGVPLLIPPLAGFRQESEPREEVLFLRDEGANMVWGIEKTVRNGLGRAVAGFEAQQERWARRQEAAAEEAESDSPDGEAPSNEGNVPRYRLATTVPDNWIPFLPRDTSALPAQPRIRLQRAQMLRNEEDEEPSAIPAMSRLLKLGDQPLIWLEEATVPRSGLRVQLTAQRVRWVDGKTYVWLGRKVLAGRGEGSSGLRFDVLM